MIGAANTDDRQFTDPDTFDIFREDLDVKKPFSGAANHVAFCAGRHFCVGAQLAEPRSRSAPTRGLALL